MCWDCFRPADPVTASETVIKQGAVNGVSGPRQSGNAESRGGLGSPELVQPVEGSGPPVVRPSEGTSNSGREGVEQGAAPPIDRSPSRPIPPMRLPMTAMMLFHP